MFQQIYCSKFGNKILHEYRAAGNMKPVPRRLVVEWVLLSWSEISKETIANSMKSCGLALATDGSDDGLISCFKEGKKCESGKVLLENQLKIFDNILQSNPFIISDQNIIEAAPICNIIDENDNDEIDIE